MARDRDMCLRWRFYLFMRPVGRAVSAPGAATATVPYLNVRFEGHMKWAEAMP